MAETTEPPLPTVAPAPSWPPQPLPPLAAGAAPTLATLAALAACGGGSEAPALPPPAPPPPPTLTSTQAARFIHQAGLGASRTQIERVKTLGYAGWLDEQFALPSDTSRWDWLVAKGFNDISFKNGEGGFDAATWRKLLAAPDTLRQRMTLALSEVLVVAIDGLINGGGWRSFAAAAYLDLLEGHAFGNLRTLLRAVSTSHAMGLYLTFKGNRKADAAKGTLPDENYARELMQLFTIGLVALNGDGSVKLTNGQPQETYTQADISGLARVFTGWGTDFAGGDSSTPDHHRRPMAQTTSRYETGAKTFLGLNIPANTDANVALDLALDHLFNHANTAPFWARQLIQRLVTSNPSPAYVQRVALAFANDGAGVRGNFKAVLKAILLDHEARNTAGLSNPAFGKLREPVLRLAAWARAVNANSASDAWALGNTGDPATRLGQSPLRSPSVFNFFRPGYVPPNSGIAAASLVAPEFQLANESSVVGFVNYMQRAINAQGVGDVLADYTALLPLADTAAALVDEINLLLAAGQLGSASLGVITTALNAMPAGTEGARRNRVLAALTLVLAAPEFLVQK